jgi:hypothetical protein
MSSIRLYRVNDIESFFSSPSLLLSPLFAAFFDEESISSLNFSKTESIAPSKLEGSVDKMYSSISPCGDVGVLGANEEEKEEEFSSLPSLLAAKTTAAEFLLLFARSDKQEEEEEQGCLCRPIEGCFFSRN